MQVLGDEYAPGFPGQIVQSTAVFLRSEDPHSQPSLQKGMHYCISGPQSRWHAFTKQEMRRLCWLRRLCKRTRYSGLHNIWYGGYIGSPVRNASIRLRCSPVSPSAKLCTSTCLQSGSAICCEESTICTTDAHCNNSTLAIPILASSYYTWNLRDVLTNTPQLPQWGPILDLGTAVLKRFANTS